MQTSDDVLARARRIKMVAMDVDGVLTDGALVLGDGGESKVFHARDGLGVSVARRAGLSFAIVTGRDSVAVRTRAEELRIEVLLQGCRNKGDALRRIAADHGLDVDEIAFVGDDWNDLPALRIAGLTAAPADAPFDIRRRCDFVASMKGGHGAVREFLEWLLDAQGGWANAAERWVETLEANGEARQ
ncbi:MAG TPA: HAD family hydrolase [Armatimonadota bacterium]|jgi:3-deoxy-D-manno-octulosonate 8-phosphate phosphatase (KDO 8-P phosphatase)